MRVYIIYNELNLIVFFLTTGGREREEGREERVVASSFTSSIPSSLSLFDAWRENAR